MMTGNDTIAPANLAAQDAARWLGISPRTLWSLTSSGQVPHLKLGRRVLYPVDRLRDWLSERTQGGTSRA